MSLSPRQQLTLALSPKVTGVLSMFGSWCIIRAILSDKTKWSCTYHRILLAMASLDFVTSFWFSMSTWPIPSGTPDVWNPVGNTASCTTQGFFLQSVFGVPCYNASLAIYYLLVSRYKWSEKRIRSIEPCLLGIPFVLSIGTAISGIPLKLYNNANVWCWIAPFPAGCKDSYTYGREAATCARGDNAWIFRWAFFYSFVWASILIAMVCMILVYWTVLQQERAVDKMQENGLALRTNSKRVAWQSFWYILAFYVTWIPATLVRLLQTIPQTKAMVFHPMVASFAVLTPMQGFLNFVVYSRARYCKYRMENKAATTYEAVMVAALSIQVKTPNSTANQDVDTGGIMADKQVATESILKSEAAILRPENCQAVSL